VKQTGPSPTPPPYKEVESVIPYLQAQQAGWLDDIMSCQLEVTAVIT